MKHAERALALFPQLRARAVRVIEDGWDSLVLDVDSEWIIRIPRRAEVAESMEAEIALLPALASALPVAIPQFELIARDGVRAVGYRKLPGDALQAADPVVAAGVGSFLAALHRFPVEQAVALGVRGDGREWWRNERTIRVDAFRAVVLPLLAGPERAAAESLLDTALADEAFDFDAVLIHGDLGPEHILCESGRVSGVLDWTDARIGDPALDLSWLLHGTPAAFADAALAAYGASDPHLRKRALIYHRLGPWYEVAYGLEQSRPELVERGLAGVRRRLPSP